MVHTFEGHSIAPLSISKFVTTTMMQEHLKYNSQAFTVVFACLCISSPYLMVFTDLTFQNKGLINIHLKTGI